MIEFEAHRGHLRAVAYRMLGSVSEAEDAVQESWIRLSRTDLSGVENLRAWLTTVALECSPDQPSRSMRLAEMSTKKAADSVKNTRGPSQIAKADGRPAVEAWLHHVQPEHRSLVRRIDALILETVPDAVCAVKFRKPTNRWGVPFYGVSGKGWIVSVNSLKARVRLIFFAGNVLKPVPPLAAPPRARAVDVRSDGELDERQIKAWLQQAKKLPGWGGL